MTKRLETNKSQLQLIKDDFRNFLYLAWKHLALPDPTPIQYDIAEYLQSGLKDLLSRPLEESVNLGLLLLLLYGSYCVIHS